MLIACAWLGAWAVLTGRRWSVALLWLNTGAAMYAALCAIGLFIADSRVWLGAVLMLPLIVCPDAALHAAKPSARPA